MTMFKRWVYGGLAIAVLTGPAGLPLRNVMSQEGHEEARPIVVNQEEGGENPFEARREREREERERPEARERENDERPTERDVLRRQVEVLKIALHGLMEGEKRDAAEIVQRAIRAREVTIEGRRDDEAHMIRERAPSQAQLTEILKMASNVWREFNNEERAVAVGRLAEAMAPRSGEQETRRERTEEGVRERTERPNEREMAKRQLEIMRAALPALREGNRADAVELMERAIRAHEVMLEGRRDDEAHQIRERMPNRGQMAEILTMASNLWREFNNQEKAEIVGRLAREFGGGERERELSVRERRETEERPNELVRRRLHELEQAFVRAREAGREDEAARIRRQMQELTQQRVGEPERRPERVEAPRASEEVERLKGSVRELSGQMNEMRREMAEIRKLLETLAEQKRDDR